MGLGHRRVSLAVRLGLVIAGSLIPQTFGADSNSAAPVGMAQDTLRGVVHDALGRALAGVEVLVLPDRSSEALASSITGPDGRFRVPMLPAGLYRIAALKPGYLASVTRANTYLRATVDVILHPVPGPGEPGSENVTASPTWVLRAPSRSILRETELAEIARVPAGAAPPAGARAPSLALVEGQFRHLVALGSNAPDSGSRGGPIVGGETDVQLTGALGQRGTVRMAGRRESLATSRAEIEGFSEGRRTAESLVFDVSYDTSGETSVDVSAYFAQGDVRVGPVVARNADDNREARRAWGYDATWTMQLDEVSRLAVKLGYRDASLEVPGAYLQGQGESFGEVSRNLSNRSIGAAGSYEVLAGDNHSIRVEALAQAIDLPLPVVRDGGEAMFVDLPGGAGWSLRIDAEDAWSVSAPWTIVYGLGIQEVLQGTDATLFVPRAGAAWSPGRVDLRVLLSYYTATAWGGGDPGEGDVYGVDRLRPARRLGWDAEISVPVGQDVSLRVAQTFEPLRAGARAAGEPGTFLAASPVIVGSQASDRRSSVALTRNTGRASSSFALHWGRAEGMIGQAAGFELPVQILAERAIEYRAGRFDVTLPASGTAVTVEYGRLQETPTATAASPIVSSYVELAMGQQIAQLARLGATCRLLLAARLVPAHELGDDASAQLERSRAIAALNQQFSAGLLVTF